MDSRRQQLLTLVIEKFIKTAEPIGSKFLVSEGKLDWSEATVRNELRTLEEEGFLTHPHTSAGRVPTEKGYRFFLKQLDLDSEKLSKKDLSIIGSASQEKNLETKYKNLAKAVAEIADATVVLFIGQNKIYYTGLSNLFNQPEFSEMKIVLDVSEMFDRCDECLQDFFDKTTEEIKYFLGEDHPFGGYLTAGAFRFAESSLFTLLGPLRMDYARHYAILKKIKEII